jgi:hypothetical protein
MKKPVLLAALAALAGIGAAAKAQAPEIARYRKIRKM